MGISPFGCNHFESAKPVEHLYPTGMSKNLKEKELSLEQSVFRDRIVDWLCKFPWTWMWTVTYDRMEKRTSQNYTRTGYPKGKPEPVGVSDRQAKKIFERYMKRELPSYSWFYVVEPNPTRAGNHVHALLIPGESQRVEIAKHGPSWWERYGWNKMERIKSRDDITAYCTKHVVRYLTKGAGWYNIEINDSEIFHAAVAH